MAAYSLLATRCLTCLSQYAIQTLRLSAIILRFPTIGLICWRADWTHTEASRHRYRCAPGIFWNSRAAAVTIVRAAHELVERPGRLRVPRPADDPDAFDDHWRPARRKGVTHGGVVLILEARQLRHVVDGDHALPVRELLSRIAELAAYSLVFSSSRRRSAQPAAVECPLAIERSSSAPKTARMPADPTGSRTISLPFHTGWSRSSQSSGAAAAVRASLL